MGTVSFWIVSSDRVLIRRNIGLVCCHITNIHKPFMLYYVLAWIHGTRPHKWCINMHCYWLQSRRYVTGVVQKQLRLNNLVFIKLHYNLCMCFLPYLFACFSSWTISLINRFKGTRAQSFGSENTYPKFNLYISLRHIMSYWISDPWQYYDSILKDMSNARTLRRNYLCPIMTSI